MPTVEAELTVPAPIATVYGYLKQRYRTQNFRSVCLMTKGYVPEIAVIEDVPNERLAYSVAGRDSLLKFSVSSWQWSYDLSAAEGGGTRIAIRYGWSIVLSVLSMWTVRHQASNEVVETVMALEALGFRDAPAGN